ncbi:MAG: hypothetical protein LBU68_01240 [Rickettsiales bacterium]|jgi:uncharacterized membrane-anchored protein YitT (DUF2179 family)|nr:hypothetical protein [Rickettsiales bacterium]
MWVKELLSTKSGISTGRCGFFIAMFMGFILMLTFILDDAMLCTKISIYHFAILGIFPLCGVLSYFLAKFYESKMILKFGDSEVQIGDDEENKIDS